MDKQAAAKSMNKILKFIPKAAQAAVLFQNPPFSPGRDHKRADGHKAHTNKGFSGPILPMIPVEARGKSKYFEAQEPTSPKISCMGQIKHKKRICKKQMSMPKGFKTRPEKAHPRPPRVDKEKNELSSASAEPKKKPSGFKKMLSFRRKSDATSDHAKPPLPDRAAPSLGQMRKFASSRDTFANFDWTAAQVAPEEDMARGTCSDEEREYSDGENDVIIPFSAPILMAGRGDGAGLALEPRKEINLWKRRTMAQPEPLQLDTVRGSGKSKSK